MLATNRSSLGLHRRDGAGVGGEVVQPLPVAQVAAGPQHQQHRTSALHLGMATWAPLGETANVKTGGGCTVRSHSTGKPWLCLTPAEPKSVGRLPRKGSFEIGVVDGGPSYATTDYVRTTTLVTWMQIGPARRAELLSNALLLAVVPPVKPDHAWGSVRLLATALHKSRYAHT